MTKQEQIDEKLKKLEQINRERPCKDCFYRRNKNGYFTCSLVTGACNFNHDHFKRAVGTNPKVKANSKQAQ